MSAAAETPQHDLQATATHEAGHAVVALALGVNVLGVVLDADGCGQVLHADVHPLATEDPVGAACGLALTVAGGVAEYMAFGSRRLPDWQRRALEGLPAEHAAAVEFGYCEPRVGALLAYRLPDGIVSLPQGDAAQAEAQALDLAQCAADLAGQDLTPEAARPLVLALVRVAEQVAEEVLRANWEAVRRLADALVRVCPDWLTGAGVREIVGTLRRPDNGREG